MQETGCLPTTSKSKLRFESVDFADVPAQPKLFLRYQADPLSLKKYYPSVVSSHLEVADRVPEVLDAYSVSRAALCEILETQNRKFEAGEKTFESIDLLRRSDTVAVLTGQQAGLFTGPLYTIYKALSAIRMAQCLRRRGFNTVPVFWAATEDHDFEEIDHAKILDSAGELLPFEIERTPAEEGLPVGNISISESLVDQFRDAAAMFPDTEFKQELVESLLKVWAPGRKIGEAFGIQIQQLFAPYGLIVVDPLDPAIKNLVAPIYADAAVRSEEIVDALVGRSAELEAEGYPPQVLVTPDYFPLFYHTDDGVRRSVRRKPDGNYHVADTRIDLDHDALSKLALTQPDRFSPGVMLRPVVQDFLFPTVCYFGGGAEVSYFAQNSVVYEILGRPVTTVLHRQSFSVVEAKHARTMAKYDLEFAELFGGPERILSKIVERFVNPSTARLFADAEEKINTELHRLDQDLERIDPTLAANLATRRKKILYHIAALQKKFHRVQIERDEIVNRQITSLFASLWPGGLQERTLNVAGFTGRYGPYFIEWIYDSIDLEERGHRLIYL